MSHSGYLQNSSVYFQDDRQATKCTKQRAISPLAHKLSQLQITPEEGEQQQLFKKKCCKTNENKLMTTDQIVQAHLKPLKFLKSLYKQVTNQSGFDKAHLFAKKAQCNIQEAGEDMQGLKIFTDEHVHILTKEQLESDELRLQINISVKPQTRLRILDIVSHTNKKEDNEFIHNGLRLKDDHGNTSDIEKLLNGYYLLRCNLWLQIDAHSLYEVTVDTFEDDQVQQKGKVGVVCSRKDSLIGRSDQDFSIQPKDVDGFLISMKKIKDVKDTKDDNIQVQKVVAKTQIIGVRKSDPNSDDVMKALKLVFNDMNEIRLKDKEKKPLYTVDKKQQIYDKNETINNSNSPGGLLQKFDHQDLFKQNCKRRNDGCLDEPPLEDAYESLFNDLDGEVAKQAIQQQTFGQKSQDLQKTIADNIKKACKNLTLRLQDQDQNQNQNQNQKNISNIQPQKDNQGAGFGDFLKDFTQLTSSLTSTLSTVAASIAPILPLLLL